MNSKPKSRSEGKPKSAIAHNFEGGSPLRLQEVSTKKTPYNKKDPKALMKSDTILKLSEFLAKSATDTKKELIKEAHTTGSKSMLDEKNILE